MIAAVPTYLGARNTAFRNVAEQTLTNSAKAAAAFYAVNRSLPNATQMKDEEANFDYVDGVTAQAATKPPTIAVDTTNNYHILNIGDAGGTVIKIDVSDGMVGAITDGNP